MTTAEALIFGVIFIITCGFTYACLVKRGFLWMNIVCAALWYVVSYYVFSARLVVTAVYANVFWALGILTVIVGFAILFMPLYVRDKEVEDEEDGVERSRKRRREHGDRIKSVRSMGRKKPNLFV